MADTRDLLVRINGDTSGLEKALGKADKSSNGLKDAFKNAEAGSFALLGGLTAASVGAAAFGVTSLSAYNSAMEASAKLKTNLLNVKGATMGQVEALEAQASALQAVGVIEDDVIKAGMSQLATFNLQGKTIQALTPKIADMVAQLKGHNATAEDMVAINNLVGKVMTGNVGALSRYGVTLSEVQKEQLKNGDETKKAAVLNEVLAQNYGKVNEALRNTPQGAITGLKNAFGDLQEGVGSYIAVALVPLTKKLSGFIKMVEDGGGPIEYFGKLIEDNKKNIVLAAGAIMGGLVPALAAMGIGIMGAMLPLLPFLAAGAGLALLANNMAEKMGGWSNMMNHLKDSFMQTFSTIKDFLEPSITALWNTVEGLLPTLSRLWHEVIEPLIPVIGTALVLAFRGVMDIANALLTVLGPVMTFLLDNKATVLGLAAAFGILALAMNFNAIAAGFNSAITGAIATINVLRFTTIPGALSSLATFAGGFGPVGIAAVIAAGVIVDAGNKAKAAWDNTSRAIQGASNSNDEVIRKLQGLAKNGTPEQKQRAKITLQKLAESGSFAVGGFTGQGAADEIAGVVHRGEFVIPKSQVNQATGLPAAMPSKVAEKPMVTEQTVINFDPTIQVGMFAGMPVEYREMAERLWVEFTRIAQSNGVKLPSIGARTQ